MSHGFSQSQRLLLRGEQRLTPQLIQSMDILQLNAMELDARIDEELNSNPALETTQPEEDGPDALEPGDGSRGDERALVVDDPNEAERALVVGGDGPREFERLDNLVREYDWLDDEYEHRGAKSRSQRLEEGDIKLEAMNNTAARPVSLQDHLLEQWSLLDLDDETRRLGARIIDFVDDNGRLALELDEIARELSPPATVAAMEEVLPLVQQLDPPGVAARTLRECLSLQLRALPGDHALEERIVLEHLEDLEKNRLPQIARALRVELDELKRAIQTIARLSLHPGLGVGDREAPPIVPDLLVEFDEQANRYDVRLTRPNLRELRISPEFRAALERARDDRNAREFIKQKIDAANAIIEAVRFRRERLLEVAKAAVEAQRDFLDQGEQHIRVLQMSELAERLGCDPSTISRTVGDKYVQTPRGIFPLRRFFTRGAETENGDGLGWDGVRARVREIVDNEPKENPLSDDQIVDRLREEGIDVKRRTVAKYRAQLNIPAARQRKQF